jgi:hypothetical protein
MFDVISSSFVKKLVTNQLKIYNFHIFFKIIFAKLLPFWWIFVFEFSIQ